MDEIKVLWLSRHEMTEDQQASLIRRLEYSVDPFQPADITVVSANVVFEARSSVARRQIEELAREHEASVVAGVLPAHIAGAFARRQGWQAMQVMVPVAIPAPAKEGEVRGGGFVHSHWETL